MIAKLFSIKNTPQKGKGLFAKEFIPKGTIICYECRDCKIVTAEEFSQMNGEEQNDFLEHAYRRKDGSCVMPCDETKFLNHSCNANILNSEKGFDIVVRDIEKGDEATYDYRTFYENSSMVCHCESANCCKILSYTHPVPKLLQELWDTRITGALDYIASVKQPLNAELARDGIFFLRKK